MVMLNIVLYKEYNSNGESFRDLFSRIEESFFVPPFQCEYTWEEDGTNSLGEIL